MFYARQRELDFLDERYRKGKFECIVLYGRKGIGKTALINEFCQGKEVIFCSCLNASAQDNLLSLTQAIESFRRGYPSFGLSYRDFDEAFDAIDALSQERRLIVIFNEFPYLAKADPSVASRLQHLIDHKWQHGRLFLIFCGSSISFMEREFFGYEAPLYGRRTGQIRLEPLTYKESAAFYPGLSPEDQALLYGITGGVPRYLHKLDPAGGLDEAIMQEVLDPEGGLYFEAECCLFEDLRETALYNSILRAMAEGAGRLNEIASVTRLPPTLCSKYLGVLQKLDVVRKETPVGELPGRKTRYKIQDLLLNFWLRFVPRNSALILRGMLGQIYAERIKSRYPQFMQSVFVKMCRDYLLYHAQDLPFIITNIGSWWGIDPATQKRVAIDLAGTCSKEGQFLCASCLYREDKADERVLEELYKASRAFAPAGKIRYCIFSKIGFTDGMIKQAKEDGVRLYTLQDLYR